MDRALDDEGLAAARDAISSAVGASFAAVGQGARAGDAAAEAVPVLEAVLSATAPGRTHTDRHEALALAALLGRRALGLGLSPTSTLTLSAALVRAARDRGASVDAALEAALAACIMEGYVTADGERVRAEVDARTAEGIRALGLADRALVVAVPASVGTEALEAALDGVARRLLAADADTCIAVVLGAPDERDDGLFASALAGLGASAMVVGARVAYVVESERLRGVLARAVPDHVVVASLPEAFVATEITVARAKKPLSQIKKFFSGKPR